MLSTSTFSMTSPVNRAVVDAIYWLENSHSENRYLVMLYHFFIQPTINNNQNILKGRGKINRT